MPDKSYHTTQQAELASDPSSPPGGFGVIYPKSDGKWYAKNSAGVVTEITNTAATGSFSLTKTLMATRNNFWSGNY